MKNFVIDSILLSNYRKFENYTFHLNPGMNVFIGKNASGKTSVLGAASVMLGAYLAAFKEYVPSRFVQNISDADVRRKNNKMSKQLAAPQGVPQFPCLIKCVMKWEEKELSFQRILEKEGSRTKFSGKNPMQKIVNSWESLIKEADGSDENLELPLVLYLSSVME